MKKALVFPKDGFKIVQVSDKEFPVSPDLFWVDCADEVDTEWEYSATGFSKKEIPVVDTKPKTVSMRQARLALLQSGLHKSVDIAIKNSPEAYQIEWEYATEVSRESPLVKTLSSYLGITEAQLDTLFETAATL